MAASQANVLEVAHERLGAGLALGQTIVELLLETRGFAHLDEVRGALASAGIVSETTAGPPTPARRSRALTSLLTGWRQSKTIAARSCAITIASP